MDVISTFLSNNEETEEMKMGWISWEARGFPADPISAAVAQYLKCHRDSLLIVTTESSDNPTLYQDLIEQCSNENKISIPGCTAASATLGNYKVVLTNEFGMGTIWISLPDAKWPEEVVNFSLDESKMPKTINRKILREMIIKEIVEDVPARAKRLAAEVAELIRNDKSHFTTALVILLKQTMPRYSSEFNITQLSDGVRKKMNQEIVYMESKIPDLSKLDIYQKAKIINQALTIPPPPDVKSEARIRKTLREMIIKELRYLKSDS